MTRMMALTALITTLISIPAAAHTGIGDAAGFANGFVHPLGGLDHVLAMVAVGLFAASLGGRALYLVPAAFIGATTVGGVMVVGGLNVPLFEVGIALSVVVLGAAVALRWRPAIAAAMALAGFFAIFHGYAHGAEMPVGSSALGYAAGFLVATALLHGLGICLGLGTGKLARSSPIVQLGGGAMALAGCGMLAAAL